MRLMARMTKQCTSALNSSLFDRNKDFGNKSFTRNLYAKVWFIQTIGSWSSDNSDIYATSLKSLSYRTCSACLPVGRLFGRPACQCRRATCMRTWVWIVILHMCLISVFNVPYLKMALLKRTNRRPDCAN